METKACYLVIQYCPNMERNEAVNIGVIILYADDTLAGVKVTDDYSRIERFFGEIDKKRLTSIIDAFVTRLKANDAEKTCDFLNTRANTITCPPPRPIKLINIEDDLNQLFKDLVEEP